MHIVFNVQYVDGSAAVAVASVADQVAFEREHDKSIATLSGDFRLTDMCWLAWHGLKRTGQTGDEFDVWIERVEEVTVGDTDIVPLETVPPTG